MAIYIVTGVLGAGKSLLTVAKIQEYVKEGRRVAGNFDLNMSALGGKRCKVSYTRVPDFPTAADLELIGKGHDEETYNEDKNGILVLDELAVWLNSREWNDKNRKDLIRWFVHARKRRWDVYLLVQDIEMIDAQIRKALCQYIVECHALDKIRVPVITPIYKLLTGKKYIPLPKYHIASVKMGRVENAVSVDRWSTSGKHLYSCYDTEQIFDPDYEHGVHSVLSPWHMEGRYLPERMSLPALILRLFIYCYLRLVLPLFGYRLSTRGGLRPCVR